MSLQKRRRELEKHLQAPPTQESFQTILNLLKEAEEDCNESPSAEGTQKLDELLAYTSEVLETWDDSLRHTSIWSVSQNSFTFQVTKAFALLHSLNSVYDDTHYFCEAYRKMWGEHNIKVLSYTPSSLTSLTLDGGCNDVNEIKVLLASPLIKQLKALNFQRRKPKTEVLKLIFLCEEASVEVRHQMLTMMPDVALRDLAKTFQLPGRSKMSRETLQDSLKECINNHQEAHAPHDTISAPPSQIAALRGLLSRPPSGMGFLRIIDFLEDWQAHQRQQDTFLYAQQHLASWPSHFCRKPGTSDLNHHFERWPFSLHGPAAVLSRSAGVSLPLEERDNTFSKAFQEDHSLASFTDLRFMFSGSAVYHREGSETVLREVLDAEQLQGLTSLGIEEMPFMEYPEEALLSSTLLKSLDTLSLCNVDFDLQIIVESPHFSSIQSFHVSLDLKEHEVEALIHSPHCKQLTSLGLPHSRIAPEDLQTLLEDAHWPALTSLCLDNTPFDDAMAAILAESPLLSQLTHLSLGHTELTKKGLSVLLSSPAIAGLQSLSFSSEKVGQNELVALAQSPHLRRLTDLHLKGQELSPTSLRKLLSSPLMESLRSLTFAAFNDKHAQVLANHPGAAQLKHLRSIEITGSIGGLFRRDKYIYYQRGAIGKEGCQAIVNSPYLHLETFDVLETFAPQEIQQALAFAPTLSEEIRYGFLRAQSKTTLQKWAKEHNISGRSKMSQYTLCEALLSCV